MIVTGIGSRKTPPAVLAQMIEIGSWCRTHRVGLRSGHATGADWAFEQGAQEFCIAYLPWASFNRELQSAARLVPFKLGSAVEELVAEVHPTSDHLSRGAWLLHGRNMWQILGRGLDRPSDAVVCWTPGGKVTGRRSTSSRRTSLPPSTRRRRGSTRGWPSPTPSKERKSSGSPSWFRRGCPLRDAEVDAFKAKWWATERSPGWADPNITSDDNQTFLLRTAVDSSD